MVRLKETSSGISTEFSIPHRSVWVDTAMPQVQPLTQDVACDVCVVGGGIAGLLIAQRLTSLGMSVVVADKNSLASGETSRTTAHFVTALDDRYAVLEKLHGQNGSCLAAESHAAAINHIEHLVEQLGIDCGWMRLDGYLVVNDHHVDARDDLLEEEMMACRRAGVDVKRCDTLPMPWPVALGPALRFSHQAQVHPLHFLYGLTRHLLAQGVQLHGETVTTKIHGGPKSAVETHRGPVVSCSHIVVATNTPINNLVAVHTKQAGYQTYVMAFRVPAGALPPLLLWDGLWKNDASYHYVRLKNGTAGRLGEEDLLIVGGEDHKTGQGPAGNTPYQCIEDWTRRHFPMCGPVEQQWSGEVMEPADGLGYIGHNAVDRDNVYIVTGDSGNGMTHGAIAALLIPDLILDRPNPWTTLYDPARKIGLHALPEYLRENINTLTQYADWLNRGDAGDESEIAPGQGAVVVKGLKHVAVYKDEHGTCTRLNAMCTHLGGVVRWNGQEKTWDCPCHASRFDRHGKMLHGPANTDLHPHHE